MNIIVERDVVTPMRDGVRLRADVYRPADSGRYPVLLQRTPYGKGAVEPRPVTPRGPLMLDPVRAACCGYAVVIQDERGCYASQGRFRVLVDSGQDGYDTVEWAAAQPWSNGRVGMYGISYTGAVQWLAAVNTPPHLVCMAPWMAGSNYRDNWFFRSGVLELAFVKSWVAGNLALGALTRREGPEAAEQLARLQEQLTDMTAILSRLPVEDFPEAGELQQEFREWLAHPDYDEFWRAVDTEARYARVTVPVLHLVGWYDVFLNGSLRNFTGMRREGGTPLARGQQKLVVGPWIHTAPEVGRRMPTLSGQVDFGPEAAIDVDSLQLRWFDHWLRGVDNGVDADPPVRVFVMGEDRWRSEADWPLARTVWTPYFLHSAGHANGSAGGGWLDRLEPPCDEPADRYVYDPAAPTPSHGGAACCWQWSHPAGAFDQREIERRADVLVYTSAALTEPLEVTGPLRVTLFASSSAPDTDFTAKLVDVCPCGFARNLQEGIVRARYRDSATAPSPIEPGRVYEYAIDLWATSNLFGVGHRIRLEISSSSFPKFDRNPNTGERLFGPSLPRRAEQFVFHDLERPSRLVLPVIPRGRAQESVPPVAPGAHRDPPG